MGKQKNRKLKQKADNPLGLQENLAESPINGSSTVSSVVINLTQKLQSNQQEDKECACSTVANLVSEPDTIKQFLQADAVRILGPLLLDSAMTVRTRALGALRNMTVGGKVNVCEEMVKQDVMTPLVALLQKYISDIQEEHLQQDLVSVQVLTEAAHLLWNLCESSEVAVKIFNQQCLYKVLLPLLQPSVFQPSLILPVVQCLHTVSENNKELCTAFSQHLDSLVTLLNWPNTSGADLLIRTSVAGLLHNVLSSRECSYPNDSVSAINEQTVSLFSQVLQTDITGLLQQTLQQLVELKKVDFVSPMTASNDAADQAESSSTEPHQEVEMDDENQATAGDNVKEETTGDSTKQRPTKQMTLSLMEKHSAVEKQLNEVQYLIQAQQLAVTIISNLCCSEEEESWVDTDSSDGSFEEIAMETEEHAQQMLQDPTVNSDVQQQLVKQSVTSLVLSKCQGEDQMLTVGLAAHKSAHPIVKSLRQLRIYSYLCWANMIDVLDQDHSLALTWEPLAKQYAAVSKGYVELVEAMTSALRAVVQKLAVKESTALLTIQLQDLTFLCESEISCPHPQTRVNLIHIVGCIGCALAKQKDTGPLIKVIAEFYHTVCSREQEVWVLAECLDCIFDVFGEDDFNDVLKQVQLIDKLQDLVPALKAKVKQERKSLGEHMAIISTARDNLSRFIKYKKPLLANI